MLLRAGMIGSMSRLASKARTLLLLLPRSAIRRLKQLHLCRGRRRQVYSERSTRAIGQYHALCSLAFLSRPDQRTPFLAGINMPSMKHASQRPCCRSSNWSSQARHRANNTPDSAHAFNRRWMIVFEPYLAGNSLHGALAHKIQSMPSKHLWSSAGGRPPGRAACVAAVAL